MKLFQIILESFSFIQQILNAHQMAGVVCAWCWRYKKEWDRHDLCCMAFTTSIVISIILNLNNYSQVRWVAVMPLWKYRWAEDWEKHVLKGFLLFWDLKDEKVKPEKNVSGRGNDTWGLWVKDGVHLRKWKFNVAGSWPWGLGGEGKGGDERWGHSSKQEPGPEVHCKLI